MSEDNVNPGEVLENGDDLITRWEAMKAALDWKVKPGGAIFNGIKDVITARLRSVPRTEGWISVNNQLPEEKGWYMVYAPGYSGGSSSGLDSHNGVMFAKWSGKTWSIEVGYYKRPGCVRQWMPIPIPKEEQDEETD